MSRHVLIVDDDRRILQLLGDALKHDYTVEIATNGGEALSAIQRRRPDLVLLDIMLPGVSGIHLLKQIKQQDPTIAVVIITGSGNAALVDQALESGAGGSCANRSTSRTLSALSLKSSATAERPSWRPSQPAQ